MNRPHFPGRAVFPALGLLALAAGCADRPKAPPLVNEAVYHNGAVGVRFLAPDGWQMTSRAELPPGPLPKPVVLVAYVQPQGEGVSEFELVAAELDPAADIARFVAELRIGPTKWVVKPPAEEIAVNGAAATRVRMSHGAGKKQVFREATVFRRGGRAFAFLVTFAADDQDRRDQVRQSVNSVTWTR